MSQDKIYPRLVEPLLVEALADTPVVLIHGPRQCGKTTLAQRVGESNGYAYFSFDNDVLLDAARTDPAGFVDDLPERSILDEVQRAPEIFTSIKSLVDRHRIPGRFLLTGSANVLLLPKLSDSLAGRMEIMRLYPLAQCELASRAPQFLGSLFAGSFKIQRYPRLRGELIYRILAGGYPAALVRGSERRRMTWYRDYIETLVQRDVRDLSRIQRLDALPRLLTLAAGQTAQLLNMSVLAGPFQVSRPTIRDYVTLLERVFLLELLPAWHSNRLKRLIKTPKIHVGDAGLACAMLGMNTRSLEKDRTAMGPLLETFILQELRRHASGYFEDFHFYHFRDKDRAEVDIVIERGTHEVAGVEVKASATVKSADFRGLHKLKRAAGNRFTSGVVLYDGESSVRFGEGMYALPIRMLWEM